MISAVLVKTQDQKLPLDRLLIPSFWLSQPLSRPTLRRPRLFWLSVSNAREGMRPKDYNANFFWTASGVSLVSLGSSLGLNSC